MENLLGHAKLRLLRPPSPIPASEPIIPLHLGGADCDVVRSGRPLQVHCGFATHEGLNIIFGLRSIVSLYKCIVGSCSRSELGPLLT